jgi:membrane protein
MKLSHVWPFTVAVFNSFQTNRGLETAKSLTYTSLFAVVPLLTLIIAILAVFPSFQVFGEQVQNMLFERLLPSSTIQLEQYLSDFAEQSKHLTWVGALMLLATAYLMLVNIEGNFNQIWGVSKLRQGVASFLLYWCVLSLGPLLLGLGFAISSYLASLTLFQRFTAVTDLLGANALVLRMFPVLLTIGAFTLVYAAVPNCVVRVRHAFVGGVVVAFAFLIVKWVFALFIATASYELVYGTFAALPIFLLWLYIGWVVILFGANLVQMLPNWRHGTENANVHPTLLILALLHLFWQRQQRGETVHVRTLLARGWSFPGTHVEGLLHLLSEQKLIRNVGNEEYALVRDLHGVSMWQVLKACPWAQPSTQDLQQTLPEFLQLHLPPLAELREKFQQFELSVQQHFQLSLAEGFSRLNHPA